MPAIGAGAGADELEAVGVAAGGDDWADGSGLALGLAEERVGEGDECTWVRWLRAVSTGLAGRLA